MNIKAWDVEIDGDSPLHEGYSGAPVICVTTGGVLAVVNTHIENTPKGTAICISHLRDIWPDISKDLLPPPGTY